jgi:hypothetical protein
LLLVGRAAVDVGQDQCREFGSEGEALVAVTRLGHHEQLRPAGGVADHRRQRRAGLAGQRKRDEHQRSGADVHVAHGAGALRGAAGDGRGPGQRG